MPKLPNRPVFAPLLGVLSLLPTDGVENVEEGAWGQACLPEVEVAWTWERESRVRSLRVRPPGIERKTGRNPKMGKNRKWPEMGKKWPKNGEKIEKSCEKKQKNDPKSHLFSILAIFSPFRAEGHFCYILGNFFPIFGFRPVFHSIPGGLTRNPKPKNVSEKKSRKKVRKVQKQSEQWVLETCRTLLCRYRPKGVKASAIARNASEMRHKCVKMGLVLYWVKRNVQNASEIRQNCVKNASQKSAEHLLDGRTPFGRYRLWETDFLPP